MKFFILLLLFSCATASPLQGQRLKTWGLQLQSYVAPHDLVRIKNAKTDLWVIDLGDPFTSLQVDLMKNGKKKLVSYMSIGEAESYRFYFSTMKSSLRGPANPNWKENFTVNYWDPEWQKIFLDDYLPRIQAANFDGVFLDVIDAFDRFPDKAAKAEAMAEFVIRISQKAREKNKDFLIILQNGVHIRRHLKRPEALLAAISGVNVENAFFEGDKEKNNLFKPNPSVVEDIRFYQAAGKFVLSLEYLDEKKLVTQYFKYAREIGVIPLAAEKKLAGQLIFP